MGEHSHPFTQTLSVNLLYTGRVCGYLSLSLSSVWPPVLGDPPSLLHPSWSWGHCHLGGADHSIM